MGNRLVFVSCGQVTPEEKAVGERIKAAIDATDGFEAYYAEDVQDLRGFAEHVFDALRRCSCAVVVLHGRGRVQLMNRGTHTLFRKKQRCLLIRKNQRLLLLLMNQSFVPILRPSCPPCAVEASSGDSSKLTGFGKEHGSFMKRRHQEMGNVSPDSRPEYWETSKATIRQTRNSSNKN